MRACAVILFCVCFTGIFGGCIPSKYTVTPQIQGKVVEAESGRPLESVKIYFNEFPNKRVLSDKAGNFQLPKVQKTYVLLIFGPVDFAPPHGILVVDVDKYETCEVRVEGHSIDEAKGCKASLSGESLHVELNKCRGC